MRGRFFRRNPKAIAGVLLSGAVAVCGENAEVVEEARDQDPAQLAAGDNSEFVSDIEDIAAAVFSRDRCGAYRDYAGFRGSLVAAPFLSDRCRRDGRDYVADGRVPPIREFAVGLAPQIEQHLGRAEALAEAYPDGNE